MKIYFPSKDKEDFMYTLEDIQAVDMEVAQAITMNLTDRTVILSDRT